MVRKQQPPQRSDSSAWTRWVVVVAACWTVGLATGCTSLLSPMTGIPVSRLPRELLGERRSDYVPVPALMLSLPTETEYRLDEGDVLGVYIEGVLPFNSPAAVPTPPPVHFPEAGSTLPPSIGFPIAIQEGGVVNLPLIEPVNVKGMTIAEAREAIRAAYFEKEIMRSDDEIPLITLLQERTYSVTVIREVPSGPLNDVNGTARGQIIQLPAQQNDVLHALVASGGLPGFNEKSEVTVFKTSRIPFERRAALMLQLTAGGGCSVNGFQAACHGCELEGFEGMIGSMTDGFVVKIPLRVRQGQIPQIRREDIELEEGDILFIESRETEFYFTGGLLPGSQFPLPRDYDLDALGALSIAGNPLTGQSGGGGGGGIARGLGGANPTQLFVIRTLPCGRTFNISVDIQQALNDSSQNLIIQPGDKLILRYKPHEELVNFGIGTFFTFGIAELLRN